MKTKLLLGVALATIVTATSCKKSKEQVQISQPPFQIGQPVSDSSPLSGNIKGTMLTGKTYTISGDVTINQGDTLLLQPGVKVNVTNSAAIIVKGTLLSLGTKDNPNWITAPNVTKTDVIGQDPTSDPAFSGKWEGINCDTTCKLLVIKWTHLEYAGAGFTTPPVSGLTSGTPSWAIFFQNINGQFILEDSWIYGTVDDAVRITSGKISIMRNTFEKCGYSGGEAVNVKSGTVGDMAYNLMIGIATNAFKISNVNPTNIETNVNIYNNTILNCGWRQASSGKGGSINYEKGASGKAYNNLIVDCKEGLRIVGGNAASSADTIHLAYGNNYNYADSVVVANEIYPTGYITVPQTSDIPTPSSFLPNNYQHGQVYDGSSVVGLNKPNFVSYTLPNPDFKKTAFAGSYNFHLQNGSPAIGKGTTSFSPVNSVTTDSNYGASEVTAPGGDIGAYQSSGGGNKH